MIKKSYEVETEGDEVVKLSVTGAGDVRLDCGSVELTPVEARQVAHCLNDLVNSLLNDAIENCEPGAMIAPEIRALAGGPPPLIRKPPKDILEYGDGGQLNPQ